MKKKSLIIIIVIVVIIIIAAATWYYFAKIKNKNVPQNTNTIPDIIQPPSAVPPVSTDVPGSEPAAQNNSPIGWGIYANTDGVLSVWVSTADIFRQYNNGDFIGVCDGTAHLGDTDFYTYGDKQIAVAQHLVTLQNNENNQ